MAGIINTSAVFNNKWNSGENVQAFSGTISVHPDLDKTYDYVLTSDPVLLQERKQIQEVLYDIFKESPFYSKYDGKKPGKEPGTFIACAKKIEKSDIEDLFYYMKEKIEQIQQLNISELIMHICEFFDLDYSHVIKKVLTVPLRAQLYRETYVSGHKKIIDETDALF